MIKVIDGTIRDKDISYKVGETLTLSANEEQRLVDLGFAVIVAKKSKDPIESKKVLYPRHAQSNQGPNTGIPLEGE